MGLDIYKLNPSHEKTDFYFIKDESAEENKYRSQLFLVFKDYLKKEKKDFISWKETFEKKYPDLNMDDYELSCISEYYIFREKNSTDNPLSFDNENELISKNKVFFKDDELVLEEVEVDILYVKEVAYQRKSMLDGFYNNFIQSCWYVRNNSGISEYESNDFVLSEDKFKEAQSYGSEHSPIKSWEFVEGKDFIYFSY
ncbi:hypothetical protein ACTOJ1_000717 [Shigella flexneri]